jgi:hypothetical protein
LSQAKTRRKKGAEAATAAHSILSEKWRLTIIQKKIQELL